MFQTSVFPYAAVKTGLVTSSSKQSFLFAAVVCTEASAILKSKAFLSVPFTILV